MAFRSPRSQRWGLFRSATLRASLVLSVLAAAACGGGGAPGAPGGGGPGAAGGPPPALPMPMAPVTETELRDAAEYVATLKSRHTTNVQPYVEGVLTRIFVKSGDRVAAGKPLMQIDPEKQRATVANQEATRAIKLAALNYARQQRDRAQTLYQGGAVPKQQLDEAESALAQAQADYDAVGAQVKEQQVELAYYRVVAPAAGVVGDIPVRTGDRVTSSTLLTTIDQNDALEVYISVPIERAKDLRMGLPVEVLDDSGAVVATTAVSFIAPQVDDQTQGVLVKAPVPNGQRGLRASQFVRARIVWRTHRGPVVPVLAVTRVNGQYFVFTAVPAGSTPAPGGNVAGAGPAAPAAPANGAAGKPAAGGGLVAHQQVVQLGNLVGDDYEVLSGLKPGELIITAGVQKVFEGMPVVQMPSGPPPGGGAAPAGGGPGAATGTGGGQGS